MKRAAGFFLSHNTRRSRQCMRCIDVIRYYGVLGRYKRAYDAYASTVTLFAKLSSPQVDFRNFPPRDVPSPTASYKDVNKVVNIVCLSVSLKSKSNLPTFLVTWRIALFLRVPNGRRIGVIALRRIISKSVERIAGHLRRSLVECLAGLLRHSRTVIRGQRSRARGPAESARRRRVSTERARRDEGERRRRRRRRKSAKGVPQRGSAYSISIILGMRRYSCSFL